MTLPLRLLILAALCFAPFWCVAQETGSGDTDVLNDGD